MMIEILERLAEENERFKERLQKQQEEFERFKEQSQRQQEEFEQQIYNMPVAKAETVKPIVSDTAGEDFQVKIVEIAMEKLEPTASDLVIFWLPEHFTEEDAHTAGQGLANVIQNRFRFAVFVKGAVDISIVKGNSSNILLPS